MTVYRTLLRIFLSYPTFDKFIDIYILEEEIWNVLIGQYDVI